MKARLSGKNKALEEICRHVSIENSKPPRSNSLLSLKKKTISIGDTQLRSGSVGDRDNCVMLKSGEIGVITRSSIKEITVILMDKTPYFLDPVNSQLLGVHKVKIKNKTLVISKDEVHCKMMLIPESNYYVAIKILHSHC